MFSFPQILIQSIRRVLMDCDELSSHRQLRAVFASEEIKLWRNGLPEADNLKARVDLIIDYLSSKYRTSGKNGLVLFLFALSEKYEEGDELRDRLLTLAEQLAWTQQFRQDQPTIPTTVSSESAVTQEANPTGRQMLAISELETLLHYARSVGRVELPRIRHGQQKNNVTGTAWLIAPGLVVTCRHVVEAAGTHAILEDPIEADDLQAQVKQMLITFDYTAAGQGIQYGVDILEWPKIDTLLDAASDYDYAILRLKDRPFPAGLEARSPLPMEPTAPLTPQSNLYILQHPLGRPQQVASDRFLRLSQETGYILYNTPTEAGTSGAPVFNRVNWQVVALHRGENKRDRCREGLSLTAMLNDLEERQPELYQEIINAHRLLGRN